MTTDEAWEAKISEYADQLSEYFPRYIHGHIGREGFENLLGRIIRETVEACAAVADRWLTVQGEIGPLQTLGIHNAAEGIGREILALIPKGDGRG